MLFHFLILWSSVETIFSVSIFPSSSRKLITSTTSSILTAPLVSSALPWTESIQPSKELSYMPMLETHLSAILSPDLKMTKVAIADKFTFQSSSIKPARISSLSFKNSIFRNIRLTYFDAGDNVQVFNCLWSPDYMFDFPMLGIDLISLGKGRVLSVIDAQPLYPTTAYATKYASAFADIRNNFPSLQGTLSGKIYDDTSFFSKNMLFGRFTDESKLLSDVLPAMKQYLSAYLAIAKTAIPSTNSTEIEENFARQKQYDIYSAEKDPAVGLFDAYFGKEWSSDFVHDYLFPLSKRGDSSYAPPIHNFKPQ